MNTFEAPSNPVELATKRAQTFWGDDMDVSEQDRRLLVELDHGAEILGFHEKDYFVESGRGLIIPMSFEASEPVEYTDAYGVTFEGSFVSYAKVSIGIIIGATTVRAVCLVFSKVTILPYFESIETDKLMYVPVLAVNSIDEVAA